MGVVKRFTIPGRPVPGVRMTRRGAFTKRDAKRYLIYKGNVGWSAKAAGVRMTDKKLVVVIDVFLCGGTIGDWDNYAKSICDGLNGVAWIDDKQVIDGRCRVNECSSKKDERAEVMIREVESIEDAKRLLGTVGYPYPACVGCDKLPTETGK